MNEFHCSINVFLELDRTHRFKDDPEWGCLLQEMREGKMTLEDLSEINGGDGEKSDISTSDIHHWGSEFPT